MQTVHAYRRTSHRYIDAYKHLDGEEFVATVKLTPPRMIRAAEDFDDGGSYVQFMRVPRNVNLQALRQALRDTMGYHGCTHEYDCCGCASRSVRTRLVAPRKLRVTTSISYNY
jgi:hypothetical protein